MTFVYNKIKFSQQVTRLAKKLQEVQESNIQSSNNKQQNNKDKQKQQENNQKNKQLKKKKEQFEDNQDQEQQDIEGKDDKSEKQQEESKDEMIDIIDNSQLKQIRGEGYLIVENNKLILKDKSSSNNCAQATFKDQIMEKGWDTLNMKVSQECNNKLGYYAIGYLEGILSYQKIRYLWQNYISKYHYKVDLYNSNDDDNTELKKNYNLMDKIDKKFKQMMIILKNEQEYKDSINQILNLDLQMRGILKGFNDMAVMKQEFKLSWEMLMIINYDGGIDNVKDLCDGTDNFLNGRRFLKRMSKMKKHEGDFMDFIRKAMRSRCSVLFKLVNDKNILMSHSTWDTYWAMQRIFKYIQFGNSKQITYSSYPACISSTDDFFIIDQNLVVTETSLDFSITSQQIKNLFSDNYHYIPEYYKIMTANHLSKTSSDWIHQVQLFKSAIYYSQWMVFDLNRFQSVIKTKKVDINQSFLYVYEDGYSETPINAVSKDQELIQEKFFSSFNEKLESNHLHANPRYIAFKENQKNLSDIDQLKVIMSYNKQIISKDLYPKVSDVAKRFREKMTYQSIAMRFDTLFGLEEGGFGAIDIKVTNEDLIRKNSCYARNGPSKIAGKEPFEWKSPPPGQPKKWDFNWELMGPNL